jgi:hypothetical protein
MPLSLALTCTAKSRSEGGCQTNQMQQALVEEAAANQQRRVPVLPLGLLIRGVPLLRKYLLTPSL